MSKKDEILSLIKEHITQQQTEMVNGIIKILLGVKDIENRTELARKQIDGFKKEGIKFNYALFLSKLGLDNNDEPVAMDIKTQPTHRVHTENISLKSILKKIK